MKLYTLMVVDAQNLRHFQLVVIMQKAGDLPVTHRIEYGSIILTCAAHKVPLGGGMKNLVEYTMTR